MHLVRRHMDYRSLEHLRKTNPAWRLLASPHAPMIVSFLHKTFIQPNVRVMPQEELASRLGDHLFGLREKLGEDAFPRRAEQYLDDWTSDTWLRKYYPAGKDEPHYDLTPLTERAIDWLVGFHQRHFVGAESRLMTVFGLLREIVDGTESNVESRIAELQRRKEAIEEEIRRARAGSLPLLDSTRVKERFLQMSATARSLLSDFREVEQNFRTLDRAVREKVATWDGGKGSLLDEVFLERSDIAESDQGKSFRAFWDFLMSPARQEELTALLRSVFELQDVKDLAPEPRLLRIHYDWLEAGEVAQRTVERLSEQLRRYLDDQALLQNRRVMQLIRSIEQHAVALRDNPPPGAVMELDEAAPNIGLTMERPLFAPPFKPRFAAETFAEGDQSLAADALFDVEYVDKSRLEEQIRRALQTREQVSLMDLTADYPLEQGLAELVAYMSLAAEDEHCVIDDQLHEEIEWPDAEGIRRRATLPLVVFCRSEKTAGAGRR